MYWTFRNQKSREIEASHFPTWHRVSTDACRIEIDNDPCPMEKELVCNVPMAILIHII